MPASLLSRWLPLLGLLLFAALSRQLARPPRAVPAGAPATEFSAARALREVKIIARAPHSIGTPAHEAVRDYLLRRCRALGLRATVQDTTVVTGTGGVLVGARVQNVVARLPGRAPGGPAVLVLSHYDSQPLTPGASDDDAGVAAALETMRALRAGPPLTHDVVWVFTDGEEVGLLGACAYAADSVRLRREVGVVLNFEARGNTGPSFLFETNAGNRWILREFARAAPAPVGSSLAYEIYRNLPNSTDFTVFKAAGLPGLNFGFVGGYAYYHNPADTPARLDLGSLQHHGEYMLPLVRHFASLALPAPTSSSDSTFFNPLGTWLVLYDARWNYGLNLAVALLLAMAIVRARRQGRLRLRGLLGGALAWVGAAGLLPATGWVLTQLVAAAYPQYAVFYDHAFYNVHWYHLALVGLGTAVFGAWYGLLRRGLRPDSLTGGGLLVLAGLQAFLQVKAPTSCFLLGFPLLFGALSWRWSLRNTPRRLPESATARPGASPVLEGVGTLLALPAVALLAPNLSFLLTTAGLGPLVVVSMLVLAILLGLLLPALLPVLARPAGLGGADAERRSSWALPLLAGLVALGALAAGHASSLPTAGQPQQTHLWYALDADQPQRAHWLSSTARADAFTRRFLSAPEFGPLPAVLPGSTLPVLHQAATALPLPPPTVAVLSDSARRGGRRLRLQVRPGRPGVVSLRLNWPAGPIRQQRRRLRVAGHLVAPARLYTRNEYAALTFFAPGPAGLLLEMDTADPGPLTLQVTARSLGLPPLPGTRPLPATMIPAPGYSSFTTQVKKRFRL
ncbi:M28 family peptidase [uncultured Hymenobacter sp.]|uniref:M28 family peptidase n=1 Tax=uncultured Hymenobacter sp. TaxID=170016 RepID=UPI0035CB6329